MHTLDFIHLALKIIFSCMTVIERVRTHPYMFLFISFLFYFASALLCFACPSMLSGMATVTHFNILIKQHATDDSGDVSEIDVQL